LSDFASDLQISELRIYTLYMRIPESCQMPDLTALDSLIPGFMNAVTFFNGDELTEREKLYIRVFVRLVNKALIEYEEARKCVMAQLQERQRLFYMLAFVDHMENCLNAARRLFGIIDAAKSEQGALKIDRILRKYAESHFNDVKNIRDCIEHMDEKIQKDKNAGLIMLSVSQDNKGVEISSELIKFDDLAGVLKRFHEVALKWMDAFCSNPGSI